MAILAAMQSASLRLIGRRPTTFFGSSNQFEQEIADLVNEVAQDVAKYGDWQALTKFATINGDGVRVDFPFPADYDRMLQYAEVQQVNSWFWFFHHVPDLNIFANLSQRDFLSWPGAWAIVGDNFLFTPAPPPAPAATYPYISKNWARGNDGALKPQFTQDNDTFLLPERLLTLGLVWRWHEMKKLDYTGEQEAFVKALDEYAAKDRGSNVIRKTRRRFYAGTYPAWPGELG
jgi:hypothetical protein